MLNTHTQSARKLGLILVASGLSLTGSALGNDLNLTVKSNGQTVITVTPGATVAYSVEGELNSGLNQGLAMFAFNLSFDGGDLPQGQAPVSGALSSFESPLGINNPAGFGGTPVNGDLIQIGGAQNTINNTFAPQPSGTVSTGLALPGSPAVLFEGQLTAPTTSGTYTVVLSEFFGNVIDPTTTGFPFWEVAACGTGQVTNLIIQVGDCVTQPYCIGKVNSVGCRPVMASTGTPSLSGADDFVVRARGLVPGEICIAIHSLAPGNQAFFGGTLCLSGPFRRLAPANASTQSACASHVAFPVSQAAMAAEGWAAGTDVYFQVWQRDSAHPDGTGVGLSNALQARICP